MNVQYQITYEDYVKVNRLHSKLPKILSIIVIPGYILMAIATIAGLVDGYFGYEYLFYLLLPLVAFAILRFIVLPKQYQRMYDQQTNLHTPTNLELDPNSMTLSKENSTTTHFWKDITAYKEDNDTLLLYLSEVQIIMVPKKYLPEEAIQEIKVHLKENATPVFRPRYQRSCVLFLIFFIVGAIFVVSQMSRR